MSPDAVADFVASTDLVEAGMAVAVSVIGGLVVALLTASHSPPIVRAVRRRLRRAHRHDPASAVGALPPGIPPPPPARLPPPPPPKPKPCIPPPPTNADFLQLHAVIPPPPIPDARTVQVVQATSSEIPMRLVSSSSEDLVVRLLGSISVDGVLLRDKAIAVLAYLAMHRTASGDVLEDACWANPSSGPVRKRLKDILSDCRSTLGIEHVPHAIGGVYAAGPNVVTDLDLFDRAVDAADRETGLERARHLQDALGLVRGRIFSFPSRSTASFGWIDVENLVSQWELRLEDVAEECALLLSDAGRDRDATEVLLRVLEVLPLNVRVTEALMRVHANAGERHLVDAVFRAHRQGLARIHGCEPDETTVDLRAELAPRSRRR